MKKTTLLSIVATTSLLLIGCGEEKTNTTPTAETTTHAEKAAMKCGEGKCGGDKKSVATEMQAAASAAVAKATQAVKETTAAATETVTQKAAEAKEAANKAVEKTVEAAKEAKAAVVEKVEEAKAAVSAPAVNTAACAGCHGKDFEKKAMGVSKIVKDMTKAEIETALKGYKDGSYGGNMKTLMKGQIGSFDDAKIKAIAEQVGK